jgi:hypothetical protein
MKQLNKVRNMSGTRWKGNSAGRANGSYVEKREPAAPVVYGFIDVDRACDRWLMKHDAEFRERREYFIQERAERDARRR